MRFSRINLTLVLCIGFSMMGFMPSHAMGQDGTPLISDGLRAHSDDCVKIDEKIKREVKAHLGVRYKRGGSSRHGVDCSGFVRLIYRNVFGVEFPYVASSQFTLPFLERVSLKKLKTGDLVFFSRTTKKKKISHVGIYLQDKKFAHALQKRGVIVSSLENAHWKARLVSAKRMTESDGVKKAAQKSYGE